MHSKGALHLKITYVIELLGRVVHQAPPADGAALGHPVSGL